MTDRQGKLNHFHSHISWGSHQRQYLEEYVKESASRLYSEQGWNPKENAVWPGQGTHTGSWTKPTSQNDWISIFWYRKQEGEASVARGPEKEPEPWNFRSRDSPGCPSTEVEEEKGSGPRQWARGQDTQREASWDPEKNHPRAAEEFEQASWQDWWPAEQP